MAPRLVHGVGVTPKTIPTLLLDIYERLGSLERGQSDQGRALETAIAAQSRIHETAVADIKLMFRDTLAAKADHDTRLRKVEGRQHWYAGAAAILGGVLSAFGVHVFRP